MVTSLSVARRPLAERKALMMLRAEGDAGAFRNLRRLARHEGFVILPLTAPFVGLDEISLLARLARAQRLAAPGLTPEYPSDLEISINACAAELERKGLRLSVLILYREQPRRTPPPGEIKSGMHLSDPRRR